MADPKPQADELEQSSKRRRARASARKRKERETLLSELRSMLCGMYVPTRRPSHIDPPFRAQAVVSFQVSIIVSAAGGFGPTVDTLLHRVSFGQSTAVPEAYNGVMQAVSVFSALGSAVFDPFDPAAVMTYTVNVNGHPYPGFSNLLPSSTTSSVFIGAGSFYSTSAALPVVAPVPILLKPADTMTVTARLLDVSKQVLSTVIVTGYLYPVRSSDDSIAGTLVD